MAKQCGFYITGTLGEICFYQMGGKYYARKKSSLTRERVMKSPAFRRTREHAATLAEASRIASKVYRLVRGEDKAYTLYREMTGKAICLLREGKSKEAVFQCLSSQYLTTESGVQQASALTVIRKEGREKEVRLPAMSGLSYPVLRLAHIPIQAGESPKGLRRRSRSCTAGSMRKGCYAIGP